MGKGWYNLADVERSTKQKIPVIKDHPYHSDTAENALVMSVGKAKAKIEAQRKSGLKASRPKSSRNRTQNQKPSNKTNPNPSNSKKKKKRPNRKRVNNSK